MSERTLNDGIGKEVEVGMQKNLEKFSVCGSFSCLICNNYPENFAVKTNPRFGGCYTCFGYETKTGAVSILVIC